MAPIFTPTRKASWCIHQKWYSGFCVYFLVIRNPGSLNMAHKFDILIMSAIKKKNTEIKNKLQQKNSQLTLFDVLSCQKHSIRCYNCGEKCFWWPHWNFQMQCHEWHWEKKTGRQAEFSCHIQFYPASWKVTAT